MVKPRKFAGLQPYYQTHFYLGKKYLINYVDNSIFTLNV
jgi:hypothetical protein